MSDQEIIEKYGLPSLDELTAELGPIDSEEKGFLMTIIDKLKHKASEFGHFLEDMLHPEGGIVAMQEASVFTNEEREAMFTLFKHITSHRRKIMLIFLSSTDEEKANYFKEFYQFFISCKPELQTYIEKAISVWNQNEESATNEAYFG